MLIFAFVISKGYEYAGNEYEYDAYADYDMSYDPMYAGEEYAEAYATEG